MCETDIAYFSDEFAKLNWDDRKETLQTYFNEQKSALREVFVAEWNEVPAGYITVIPTAEHGPFSNKNIPEIKDFNVLPQFRKRGIGNLLMDCAETFAKQNHSQITLGVGLYPDYGTAQRMYVKRGYIPDGTGLWHGGKNLAPYENCVNDDELNLYFIKQLR
jgi:GNAT superfamily N-acetyltransferase